MFRLWLLWLLWLLWGLSAAERCDLHHSAHTASAVLKSLQCYNDYQSYFHCTWRNEHQTTSNQTLKLWLKAKNARSGLCEDHPSAAQGTSECRYKTRIFSPGTTYTAFFNETVGFCSGGRPTGLDLSTICTSVRARAPENLSTSTSHDGDRLITWSSPYPQSSALNNNITYELSYRADGHNSSWTSQQLWDNQKKLEKKELSPGHRYEARVRTRVRLGQWSHWSPTVSWYTQPDPETAPPVDCVLWGEQEVQCRWEQSIELVHFISYQLVCRHSHTAPLERCCEESTSSLKHQGDTVRFSCSLRLTQPLTSDLQVALVPARSTKTFSPTKHIRPPPPTDMKMTEMGHNWLVEWTPPKMRFQDLDHELCYYSLETERNCSDSPLRDHISEDMGILHVEGSSVTIRGLSVRPSHRYRVKVRTRVLPPYQGTPSDWSAPLDWTSHAAVWPVSYWIYIFVAVLVAKVFLVLFIVPACRRKAVLWVESVPSPGKSKVILDIQTVINHKVKLYESYPSKALDMDSVSTCSSYVSLRSTKSPDPPQAEQVQLTEEEDEEEEEKEREEEEEEAVDEGIWSCENSPVSPLVKGSMTFTGPYILCQSVKSNPEKHVPEQTELSCPDVGRPATTRTVSFEEGYVRLPNPTLHRSVQDLPSQTRDGTEEISTLSTEESQRCVTEDCASQTLWPHGGAIQGSGYCQLPPDFTCAQPAPQIVL